LKKFAVLGVVAACLGALGITGVASAGPEADDSAGNFLVLDADFTPPASSTKKTASAVALNFHASFGNKKTGAPFPAAPTVSLAVPKGAVFNGESFPACEPAKTAEEIGVETRCGREQLIGGGTAVVDARSLGVNDPLHADLVAYNQKKFKGAPTIAVFASVAVPGSADPLLAEIDLMYKNGKLSLYDPPASSGRIQYSFDSFDLVTYAVEKVSKKQKISLWEAPAKCPKAGWKWAFTATSGATSLTAKDTQGCVQLTD
jgi:hypothetical protein